jgi:hypothetical protein
MPFIPGLGSLWFDPSAALLRDQYNAGQLIASVGRDRPQPDRFSGFPIFGYNPTLHDQRMNLLYFQTTTPLRLRGYRNGKCEATAKIYAHVYPNGYILLFVAISLIPTISVADTLATLAQFDPTDDTDHQWTWSSRIGAASLNDIVNSIKAKLRHSLFSDEASQLRNGKWYSAVRLTSTVDSREFAATLIPDNRRETSCILDRFYRDWPSVKSLIVNRSQFILILVPQDSITEPDRRSGDGRPEFLLKRSKRFFWKAIQLANAARLRKVIYDDYISVLRSEILMLKAERFDFTRKLTRPTFKLSVYDCKLPAYITELDLHVRNAAPFHRWIHTVFAGVHGAEAKRMEVLRMLEEWEQEVGKWETFYSTILRRLFSPLRSILGVRLE